MTRSQAEKDALERMQKAVPPLNAEAIAKNVYEACYQINHLIAKLENGKSWTKQGSVEHLLLDITRARLVTIWKEVEAVEKITNRVIEATSE